MNDKENNSQEKDLYQLGINIYKYKFLNEDDNNLELYKKTAKYYEETLNGAVCRWKEMQIKYF